MHLKFDGVEQAFEAIVKGVTVGDIRTVTEQTRNGPVKRIPEVLVISYVRPNHRVLLNPGRDANPFFHLLEAIWMLAGSNELRFLTPYIKNFGKYSDNGSTLHGAYGYRWIHHFNYDQLEVIVKELDENPQSRRAVLQMWNAYDWQQMDPEYRLEPDGDYEPDADDLYVARNGGKDVPCNLCALFEIETSGVLGETVRRLNMTVFNRSNDLIKGSLGANFVHFTILQEYLANWLGVEVGIYNQVSNNAHIYESDLKDVPKWEAGFHANRTTYAANGFDVYDPVPVSRLGYDTLWEDREVFETILHADQRGWEGESAEYRNPFLDGVIVPALEAHELHRDGRTEEAREHAWGIKDNLWAYACAEWLGRRIKKS